MHLRKCGNPAFAEMRKSRVHKPACISIAGMAAEDAQMGSVVTSRAFAAVPVSHWFGYVTNICCLFFLFFLCRPVWICDPTYVVLFFSLDFVAACFLCVVFSVFSTGTYTHSHTTRTYTHINTRTYTHTKFLYS